jgi:hypothetical protein
VETIGCPIQEDDAAFILSPRFVDRGLNRVSEGFCFPSLAVILLLESALRQPAHARQTISNALERNANLVVILESTITSRENRQLNLFLAALLDMPRLFLLHSRSHAESAVYLQDLFARQTEHFYFSADWVFARTAKIAFLTKAPHCGVGRALSLLKFFASMREIVTASPQQLRTALGGAIDMPECEKMANFFSK